MSMDFYIKKKHLFKNRAHSIVPREAKLRFGSAGFVSQRKQRFDFVFLRFFKKILRRRYCKIKMRFFRPKLFYFFKSNYICSAKSKNARMGAGTGSLVRLVMHFYPGYTFLEFRYYSIPFLKKGIRYLELKCNLNFLLFCNLLHHRCLIIW